MCSSASAPGQAQLAQLFERWSQQIGIVPNPEPQAGKPGVAEGPDAGKVFALAEDKAANQAASSDHLMSFLHWKGKATQVAVLVLQLQQHPGATVLDKLQFTALIGLLVAPFHPLASLDVDDLTLKQGR